MGLRLRRPNQIPRCARNDNYLARVPEPARPTLEKVRAVTRSIVPLGTSEALSYGIPTFRNERGLVSYAAFKDHCSLFPPGSSVLDAFADELGPTARRMARFNFHSTSRCPQH